MNRLRTIIAVVAVVALAALFAPTAQAEVVFWTWWHVDEEDLARMSEYVGEEVVYREVSFEDFLNQMVVAVAGGSAPDLIYVDPQWFDEFARLGTLTDLGPFIERDTTGIFFDDIFPTGMDLWKLDGRQLALPANVSPTLWWYNGTMFSELGIAPLDDSFDWEQFFEVARRATRDTNGDGLHDAKGLMPWWFDIATLIWSNGGELFVDGELAIDSDAAREALIYYKEFWDRELIVNWEELAHLGFAQVPDRAWKEGYVAFAPGGDWVGPSTVRDPNTDEWFFDVQVAHVPRAPSGGRAGILRGNGLAIPTGAKNPEGAWRLIAYILDDYNQTRTAQDGQLPSRISIAQTEYLEGGFYPYSKDTIIATMAYQRPPDTGVLWSQTYAIWNSPVKSNIEQFLTGAVSLEGAIETMKRQVSAMLAEARERQ